MMEKIYSALVVPYDENGNVYEKGLREVVRYNIEQNKVDGLYVGGSSGENFLISTAEKKQIFDIVYDENQNKVDLIAQIGSINLMEAKELAKYVAEKGYKTISAVTPFYYNFDFSEIKHYYFEILKDVEVDMIIYSIPALTGVNLSIGEFEELFQNPKIKGIKFTANDFYLLERVKKQFPDKLIYFGIDEMLLSATSLGVDGAIGSTYNLNAPKAREIMKAVKQGELEKARALQHETNDMISDLLDNGLYNTIKLILSELGVDAKYCREPMKKPNQQQRNKAKAMTEKYFA